ncbi:unnamed protein product [Thelazia callipaeda]|uniref:Atx10homo_assoc domain-containing protein n=1 Tax=Thelazia callipaeda TaxID=103827 RepID=A0A0N5CKR9_THECL|nr:unnamed protein product [Thelazia callipaeda]
MWDSGFLDIAEIQHHKHDIQWIKSFRRSTVLSSFSSYINHYEVHQLRLFMHSILEAILENCKCDENFEINVEERERRKLLLQCLVNTANHSPKLVFALLLKLRSCADEFSDSCLKVMLRWYWLRNESLAAVISFSKPENGEMHYKIVYECCVLWNEVCHVIKKLEGNEVNSISKFSAESGISENNVQEAYETRTCRSWLIAIFSKFLEDNESFFSVCCENMESCSLDTFIDILDTVIEFGEEGSGVKLAIGNVKYVLSFLERALKIFGPLEYIETEIEEDENFNSNDIVRICILLEIILKLASLDSYRTVYVADTTALKLVLHVLEGVCFLSFHILHYEYCKQQGCKGNLKSEDKFASRPEINLTVRNASNVNCIRRFGEYLRKYENTKLIATIKMSSLELLGILCYLNDLNREYAGIHDGITLLLRCMYTCDNHDQFGRLYAIAALRHLVLGYAPNQLRLAQLAQEPSAVIDRDGLLKELGLRAVYDRKAKKIRLESIAK